jgi:diguanylate cyclase (GGDEF)-like protein
MLYFVPIWICGSYFSRWPTVCLCVIVAFLFKTFGPNPYTPTIAGGRVTPPHLDLQYIGTSLNWLALFVLWGLVVNLLRDQRQSIERLGWESLTDALTGVYNRRFLQAKLKEEKARADRYKRSLSILMADIDHFKAFNDSQGHQKGDALLAAIGKLLHQNVRELDVVCRYGGEEFLVLLPETDGPRAEIVAERLRSKVEKSDFGAPAPVTVSIGLATYPTDADSPEMVISEADGDLYQAKEAGRNRVCRAKPKTGQSGLRL